MMINSKYFNDLLDEFAEFVPKKKRAISTATSVRVKNQETQTDEYYPYPVNVRLPPKSDIYAAKLIDPKVSEAGVKLMTVGGLSSRQTILALQIVANDIFGQAWKLPNDLLDVEPNETITIDNDSSVLLPAPKHFRECRKLISIEVERKIGEIVLKSSDKPITFHSDETGRQKIGQILTTPITVDGRTRFLPALQMTNHKKSNLVSAFDHIFSRLATASNTDKLDLWRKITALMGDLASENKGLSEEVAKFFQTDHVPGSLSCTVHSALGFDAGMKKILHSLEMNIGTHKMFANIHYLESENDSKVASNLAVDAILRLVSPDFSHKTWCKYFKFTEFLDTKHIKNECFALKDRRFGKLSACSAVTIRHWNDIKEFLQESDSRNQLECCVRSYLNNDVIKLSLVAMALVGIHLIEPYLGLILDAKASNTELLKVFPKVNF